MAYGIEVVLRGQERTAAGLRRVRDGVLEIAAAERKMERQRSGTRVGSGSVMSASEKLAIISRAEANNPRTLGGFMRAAGRFGFGGEVGAALSAPTQGLVALGLAGVSAAASLKAINEYGTHVVEGLRREIDARKSLAEATKSMRDAAGRSAGSIGIGSTQAMRALVGAGGNQLQLGEGIATRFGAAGLDAAASLSNVGALDERSAEALRLAVESGLITPDQFASAFGKNGGLSGTEGNASDLARAVIAAQTGMDPGDIGARLARVGRSKFGRMAATTEGMQGDQYLTGMEAFMRGDHLPGMAMDSARMRNPGEAARLEEFRKWQEEIDTLKRIDVSTAQSNLLLYEFLKNRPDLLQAQRTGPEP